MAGRGLETPIGPPEGGRRARRAGRGLETPTGPPEGERRARRAGRGLGVWGEG